MVRAGLRRMGHKRWLVAAFCIWCGCRQRPDPLPGFPRLVLWAWERPERLEFLNPRSAGVAFLARTVSWNAGQITSRPRLQPLRVPPETALMAVVRLESHGLPLPETGAVGSEILKAASLHGRAGPPGGFRRPAVGARLVPATARGTAPRPERFDASEHDRARFLVRSGHLGGWIARKRRGADAVPDGRGGAERSSRLPRRRVPRELWHFN